VLSGLLRTVSVVASLIVIVSFGLFALDESRKASQHSVEALAGLRGASSSDPSPQQERARERAHTRVREVIDDANDVLVAPFAGVTSSSSDSWARRGVPALLALLVYGFGLGLLAGYARDRS
jgi:hypothetical protein